MNELRYRWWLDREAGGIRFAVDTSTVPQAQTAVGRAHWKGELLAAIGAAYDRAMAEAAADPEVRAFYAGDPVALARLDAARDAHRPDARPPDGYI